MKEKTKSKNEESINNSENKIANECAQNGDDYFEYLQKEFEKVTLTPIPYYQLETIQLDEKTRKYLDEKAVEHCCTIGEVINHYLEDFVSIAIEINELSLEKILELQKEKRPVLLLNNSQPIGKIRFFNSDIFKKNNDNSVEK